MLDICFEIKVKSQILGSNQIECMSADLGDVVTMES